MKDILLLSACGLLAAGASALTTIFFVQGEVESAPNDQVASPGASSLESQLASLETKQQELDRYLTLLNSEESQSPASTGSEQALASAVDAWLTEHAGDLVATGSAGAASFVDDVDPGLAAIRDADIIDLIDLLNDESLTPEEHQLAWQRIAEAGRLEEVVQELKRMIEQDPQDPDLRVTLGNAYLQQLFAGAAGPKAGILASDADQAYAAALQLDEGHWEARFMKAVSLSNWPAFMGKQGEAIAEYKRLIEIQEQQDAEPQQAQTYLFLGNMYLETGAPDKALATWRRGLERFPASDELRRQIELNGGGQ